MQTFLPYPDFEQTMAVLDRRRLGKQRVETLQVIRGLTVPGYGWRHHPAVKMWAGCLEALGAYGLACSAAWVAAGYADTCADTIRADLAAAGLPHVRGQAELSEAGELPDWLGDPDFHRSHRSALLRKEPEHYAALFPGVPDDLPYVWPAGRVPVAGPATDS